MVSKFIVSQARPHQIQLKLQLFFISSRFTNYACANRQMRLLSCMTQSEWHLHALCIWSDPILFCGFHYDDLDISTDICRGSYFAALGNCVRIVAAATLWQVFTGVRDGTIVGSSSFTFPPELLEQPVACCVALSLAGPFQDCPLMFRPW